MEYWQSRKSKNFITLEKGKKIEAHMCYIDEVKVRALKIDRRKKWEDVGQWGKAYHTYYNKHYIKEHKFKFF